MGTKLTFAPVFYTLAQFKFNPITQIAEYVPRIQEHLRHSGYPDFQQENLVTLNIRRTDDPQPEMQNIQSTRWSFTDAKGHEGYLLFSDSLIFHTTEYVSFDSFSKRALDGLQLVHEMIDIAYIDRIGLRYLDCVMPNKEPDTKDSIDYYLSESLLGLSSKVKGKLSHAFTETMCLINDGTLISRSIISENGLAIPPDLMPLKLKLPSRVSETSGRNAVLDIDYFITKRLDGVDIDKVNSQLITSHDIITSAFQASVTEHAMKAWE